MIAVRTSAATLATGAARAAGTIGAYRFGDPWVYCSEQFTPDNFPYEISRMMLVNPPTMYAAPGYSSQWVVYTLPGGCQF